MKALVIRRPTLKEVVSAVDLAGPLVTFEISLEAKQVSILPINDTNKLTHEWSARIDSLRWINKPQGWCEIEGMLLPQDDGLKCQIHFRYNYKPAALQDEMDIHYN
jgi:hypothetical protein